MHIHQDRSDNGANEPCRESSMRPPSRCAIATVQVGSTDTVLETSRPNIWHSTAASLRCSIHARWRSATYVYAPLYAVSELHLPACRADCEASALSLPRFTHECRSSSLLPHSSVVWPLLQLNGHLPILDKFPSVHSLDGRHLRDEALNVWTIASVPRGCRLC